MNSLLTTWQGQVEPSWVDYNGHLNDAYYLVIFSRASDALMGMIGLDAAGRKTLGHTLYTLEVHLNYVHEVHEGVTVKVRTQLLGVDAKRVHLFHTLHRQDDGVLLATNEQMLINIDASCAKSTHFAPQVGERLQELACAHQTLPRPAHAGRAIAMPTANPVAQPFVKPIVNATH